MRKLCILIIILLSNFSLVGCRKPIKEYRDENFIYDYRSYMNEDWIYLKALTKEGKEKEYLVVPNKYNGYPVRLEGYGILQDQLDIRSDKLIKIYISNEIKNLANFYKGDDVKIICISNNILSFTDNNKNYVSLKFYEELNEKGKIKSNKIYPANLSYQYNYEDAPNDGYYWLDDYDNENIVFIPQDPVRIGYIFGGWYKEEECINKWDFGDDIIPAKEYDDKNKYIINETILYAKWI